MTQRRSSLGVDKLRTSVRNRELTHDATSSNPAAAFYASPAARALGAAVRAAHGLSAELGTALAMRLFFTPVARDRRARRSAVPAPWQPQRHRFERGALVSWQRADTAGARRVLLTHGWAGDAQQMRPLGEALAAAGFDPVLLDLPAHGASDGARATLPQWVRALFTASAAPRPLVRRDRAFAGRAGGRARVGTRAVGASAWRCWRRRRRRRCFCAGMRPGLA